MQPQTLEKLYKRAKIHARAKGLPEMADDFAGWYAVKLLEGTRKNSTIGQCFIDYLREERGNEERGRGRYKLGNAIRASDCEGGDGGPCEEGFGRFIAASGHYEAADPESRLLKRERERDAIGALDGRSKRELFRLYREGWQLAEIGELHGVTESRVSQVLTQITSKLKRKGIHLEITDQPEERPDARSAAHHEFKF